MKISVAFFTSSSLNGSMFAFFWMKVAGLVLIGAGIYLYVYKAELLSYVYSMPLARPACIIIITVGSAVLIPAFCGLLGAVRENHILLMIASIFWFLLLVSCSIFRLWWAMKCISLRNKEGVCCWILPFDWNKSKKLMTYRTQIVNVIAVDNCVN